jgi:peptide/nickel transport system permease protein
LTARADPSVALEGAPAGHETLVRAGIRRFARHRLAVTGVALLTIVLAFAIFGPFLLPDPYHIELADIDKPPSATHVLGGDQSGRDVAARVATGARTSLIVGFGSVAVYVVIGTLIGLVAGFLGRVRVGVSVPLGGGRHMPLYITVDNVLMRFTDVVMSIPTLLLIIVFVSVVGPSLVSVIAIIGLLGWPATARIIRGLILQLREAEFVTAARVVGVTNRGIAIRHLLPNVLGPLSVLATFGVATAILLEATLSFLGLGVQSPEPSLGNMIFEARDSNVLKTVPWLWLPPGILIAMTVLAVNFVGDGLRDALDPRSTRRA